MNKYIFQNVKLVFDGNGKFHQKYAELVLKKVIVEMYFIIMINMKAFHFSSVTTICCDGSSDSKNLSLDS